MDGRPAAGFRRGPVRGRLGRSGQGRRLHHPPKFPADYLVPPHSHPGDETVRVITGGPRLWHGRQGWRGTPGTLEKGYHVTLGAGMNHWAHAPVETAVQVNAKGPFAIKYANPADDPRTAK